MKTFGFVLHIIICAAFGFVFGTSIGVMYSCLIGSLNPMVIMLFAEVGTIVFIIHAFYKERTVQGGVV